MKISLGIKYPSDGNRSGVYGITVKLKSYKGRHR